MSTSNQPPQYGSRRTGHREELDRRFEEGRMSASKYKHQVERMRQHGGAPESRSKIRSWAINTHRRYLRGHFTLEVRNQDLARYRELVAKHGYTPIPEAEENFKVTLPESQ